jgi:hypothetical protein
MLEDQFYQIIILSNQVQKSLQEKEFMINLIMIHINLVKFKNQIKVHQIKLELELDKEFLQVISEANLIDIAFIFLSIINIIFL